jgi:hypothetical protein
VAVASAAPPSTARAAPAVLSASWLRHDGLAEVSAYAARQVRYDVVRDVQEVLLTVAEDQDPTTLVKALPDAQRDRRRSVIKLNREITMPAGAYTYRQLVSVFVEEDTLRLTKIAMSSQEWCGTTFVEALVRDGKLVVSSFSYLEGEGDRRFEIDWPAGAWAADALPVLARSMGGRGQGGSLRVKLLPSLVGNSVSPPALVDATVQWTAPEGGGQSPRTRTVTVIAPGRGPEVLRVEAAGDRRILEWRRPDGGTSALLRSKRLAYWTHHGIDDSRLRDELFAPR